MELFTSKENWIFDKAPAQILMSIPEHCWQAVRGFRSENQKSWKIIKKQGFMCANISVTEHYVDSDVDIRAHMEKIFPIRK